MNGLINIIQIVMNSNNAPVNNAYVQLIENLFKQCKKNNILVALQNKTNTNVKIFRTIKAHHIHNKYTNHQP